MQTPVRFDVCSMKPDLNEAAICEELADLFSSINNNLTHIDKNTITPSNTHRIISIEQVADRLLKCKKTKGLLYGDIFPHLITRFANTLAVPLSIIYNRALHEEKWPRIWKLEYVTPIPKVTSPSSYNELRNISCMTVFSKVLEYFILKQAKEEVTPRINQFGGLAGSSTNHYLISVWNDLLESVEGGEQEAVNLISIDFAKAFNKMDHTACINAFKRKGASQKTINMIAAFLSERTMCIKIGETKSSTRPIMGGSPQGTLLGNFLFIITTDELELTNYTYNTNQTQTSNVTSNDTLIDLTSSYSENPSTPPSPSNMPHCWRKH